MDINNGYFYTVPVIKKTWGPDARHLVFYSEIADAKIPTVSTGVPNTERGTNTTIHFFLRSSFFPNDVNFFFTLYFYVSVKLHSHSLLTSFQTIF